MKKVFIILTLFLTGGAFAQTSIAVSSKETVSLIFPFPIRHVDRGTKEVFVQQPSASDNILLVKASTPQMAKTNLSVIVSDGSVYVFTVDYADHPGQWIYELPTNKQATIASYASGILDNPIALHGIRNKSWEMQAMITGIYIKDKVMYYQLRLDNQSPIDYDIDFLRFYIRDKKKGKRTAVQENELVPLYIVGNTKSVTAYNSNTIVVALNKFTIPDAKFVAVQIHEQNGGRHLFMKVKNNKIMKAIILPDRK